MLRDRDGAGEVLAKGMFVRRGEESSGKGILAPNSRGWLEKIVGVRSTSHSFCSFEVILAWVKNSLESIFKGTTCMCQKSFYKCSLK